jgi:hypothetical protein
MYPVVIAAIGVAALFLFVEEANNKDTTPEVALSRPVAPR